MGFVSLIVQLTVGRQEIEHHGGRCSDTMTTATTLLILNDGAKAGKKVELARKRGVVVQSLTEFQKTLVGVQ